MKAKHILFPLYSLIAIFYIACDNYLDEKPNDGLVVPEGLEDLQKLLDNDEYINGGRNTRGADPAIATAGADEYYLKDVDYEGGSTLLKAIYTWNKDIPWPNDTKDWVAPYRVVFYANIALEGLEKIQPTPAEQAAYNNIKGSALFYRSFQFWNLAQVFAPPFDEQQADNLPGIPLRETADISTPSRRATLKETYDKIIADLLEALPLLPDKPLVVTRPSKPAVLAMLSRVYLSMGNYEKSLEYSDASLKYDLKLIDFNQVNATQQYPFNPTNDEVLYYSGINGVNETGHLWLINYTQYVDTNVYKLYTENDLRKNIFFFNVSNGHPPKKPTVLPPI